MNMFVSKYTAKIPDEKGYISYDHEENAVWEKLYDRQSKILPGRACSDFIKGLSILELQPSTIPQLPEVNQHLFAATKWRLVPVPSLITAEHFFSLLAERCFPAATFIRRLAELDYVQEPDMFHEVFGHAPMLTEPVFANFVEAYAKKVQTFEPEVWPLLQRLFWFTVEFGLIQTKEGIRAYGGGILSSFTETQYCVESSMPLRKPFDVVDILRTPYRIDELQKIYFVITSFDELFQLIDTDMRALITRARELGEHAPTFKVDPNNPNLHINAC